MLDYMDFRFYTRRILISNVFWILALLHAGVDCKLNFEVTGSKKIGFSANLTCTYDQQQFFVDIFKDGIRITRIIRFGLADSDSINSSYINRVNISKSYNPMPMFGSYTLILNDLQCSDEGNYMCRVDNKDSSQLDLQLKSDPHKPSLTAPNDFVVLGDLVTLQCTANVGKPPKNLLLRASQRNGFSYSDDITQKDLGNCSFSQTASMTINITEDTNRAFCEVENATNFIDTKDWKVRFPVLDIKIFPNSTNVKLMEGLSMSIDCQARGNPPPKYKWEFQSQNLNPTTIQMKTLVLNNVGLDDTGIYTCIASNEIRNDTYNMTKSITVDIVPTTPAPTTTPFITTTVITSSGTNGNTTKTGPQTNENKDDWKLIVGIVVAILFLIILIILLVILYRRRTKPVEIEEPPEKPRNNHEVNMKETKPDLVYSTGIEKGKHPMYNTGFDHNGEDDLYYAELAFDDKPRSRKPIVPLYDNLTNNDSYTTVMPQV